MSRIAICLCASLFLLAGCSDAPTPQGRRASQGRLERGGTSFPVEVAKVMEQDVVEWIRGVGSVYADKSVTLGAEVGGRVSAVYVEVGDVVAEAKVLARLDDERLRIARSLARAEVDVARANLENAKRNAQRQVDLFKDRVISEQVVEDAELQVDIYVGQLEMAEARLAAARRDRNDATIVSPIDGEVTRRHIEVGELIQPGDPLFDIANIEHVKVRIDVSEYEVTRIRKGQPAKIEVDGYPGVVFHGKVHTIGAEADPQTRTFPVEILVVNDRPEKLLPGFIGRVQIQGRTFESAIFLQEEIVVERDGRFTAFVVSDGTASARTLELGFRDRGRVLVVSGLEAGDNVVVSGQQSLRDGAEVLIR